MPQTPLTLDAIKAALKIRTSADDGDLVRLIASAIAVVEESTGRALRAGTGVYYVDRIRRVRIPIVPITSITSVVYTDDTTGLDVTVSSNVWYESRVLNPYRSVIIRANVSLPSNVRENTVRINYVTGAAVIPAGLDQAIVALVGAWYNNPEASSPIRLEDVPFSFKMLLQLYQVNGGAT